MGIKCPKCDTDNPSDSKYCKECAASVPSSEEISVSPTETLETPKEEAGDNKLLLLNNKEFFFPENAIAV